MKKKAVFISCFDSYDNRVRYFINVFEDKGYEIKYIFSDFDHIKKRYHEKWYKDGVRIHVISYKKNISLNRLLSHFIFAKKTIRFIKTYKPDFIYCMVPPNSLVKEIGKHRIKNRNIKLTFDVYDMWPESFPYSWNSVVLRIPFEFWRNLRKKYIGNADLILSVSEEGKKRLVDESRGSRIEVIKPTVPAGEMPEYNPNDDEFTFCYLGMINYITDIDLGVSLLGTLAKEKKTVLHIIGEGQYLEKFVESLRQVGVEVICHGCIFDQSEKNKIFSICNMGLNIPREEIYSTMSLKAIEYMRVGLPFINSAKGEIRRIVDCDRIGINVETNIETLVNNILCLKVLDYKAMHDRCVESYENRFIAQDYKAFFQDL